MEIEKNVSLKEKNWFQTGGPAEFYCQPKTSDDFCKAIEFAKEKNFKITILGQGANVLISDNGVKGLVIHPKISEIRSEDFFVTAGSGVTIQELIDWCLKNNLVGLEEFSGIPGSIGGAAYINVHYFNFFISQFLVSGQVVNKKTSVIKTVENGWFEFGYDESKLQEKDWFLVSATFKLKKVNKIQAAYAKGRSDEIIRQRNSRYPNSHTCGSFFRNFNEDELHGRKIIFVAYYLDKLGIKGELSHGGAVVSHKHANMLVNKSNATSNDIITLARKMQRLVFNKFGLIPVSECQFLGFDDYPLHRHLTLHHAKSSRDTQPSI